MDQFMKLTHDNWCGNYDKKYVSVSYRGNICRYDDSLTPLFRIVARGNDDFIMIFDTQNEQECIKMFDKLYNMEYIDISDIEEIGFVSF